MQESRAFQQKNRVSSLNSFGLEVSRWSVEAL
jgi:hypothetical protein